MASDSWHGVHPLSVLVNFVPRTWSLLRTAWPVLLAVLYGGRGADGIADAITLAVFFALPFLSSTIHALTLRYRVADGRLEIRSGLLNRQARTIGLDRIQNVEQVQNVYQRISGLVEVRIETASGREVEGLLSAVSTSAADALVAELNAGRRQVRGAVPHEIGRRAGDDRLGGRLGGVRDLPPSGVELGHQRVGCRGRHR